MPGVPATPRCRRARRQGLVIRNQIVRAGLGLAGGFAGTFAVIEAVDWLGPTDRGAEVVLGVPDLRGYCSRDESLLPLLVAPDPYGWECAGPIANIWTSAVIDFDEVCRWQYDEQASAQLVDPDRPEGWRCISTA